MTRTRIISLLTAAVVAAALWFAWFTWLRERPALPDIDLANATPELVKQINDASTAVRHKPSSADAWGRLGMVLLAHEYFPEASHCFTEAARRDPQGARWLYLDTQASAKIFPLRAVESLQKAVAIDGEDTTFRMFLGDLLLEQDRIDDAEQQYLRVLANEKHQPWGHLRLAQIALRRNQPKEALEHAKRAQPGMPGSRELHVLLSEIYFRLGDANPAEREYQKSLALAPVTWADPYMEEVQRLKTDVLGQLSQANRLTSDPAREIAMLEAIVRANPQSVPAHINLVKAFEKAKQWGAAAAVSARALKLDPDNAVALYTLGLALSMQGPDGRAQAIDVFKRALQQNPHNADTYFWLGYCYDKQNQRPAAIDALREAVRLRPNFAGAWVVLGQLYAGENDTEAMVCLRRALDVAPDDPIARKSLDEIQKRQKK